MKLTRLFFFLMILGGLAIAARAQTPLPAPSSGGAADPRIVVPDACPADAFCANLTAGPLGISIPECGNTIVGGDLLLAAGLCQDLFFEVATGPISVPPVWTCSSDYTAGTPPVGFLQSAPNGTIFPPTFSGCAFADGGIPAGTTISIAVEGVGGVPPPYVTFVIPAGFEDAGSDITLSPEPGTSLLFMSGLLLISLGGIARKRFGTTSRT
jgi:hypothetical protein